MNMKVKAQSSSIFAYGYRLVFFFLVSFRISNAQTATTDPSEGTSLSLSLSLSVFCNKFFISFHFNVLIWTSQICIYKL